MIKRVVYIHLVIMYCIMAFTPVKAQNTKAADTDKNKQIVFIENDWNEALKQAALQNKYIFVDAYASWCGPCKMLKLTTFRNSKAAQFFNQHFVNVALDMEKGIGPQLAANWGMTAYPTLIIFNAKGEPVSGTVGYIRANDLITFGQTALNK